MLARLILLCSLLLHLTKLHLTWHFSFLGQCWDTVVISVSCHQTNCLRYSSWLILCSRGDLLQSIRLCPFQLRPPFVSVDMHSFANCVVIQSDMLNGYYSPAHLILSPFSSVIAFTSGIISFAAELGPFAISSSSCGYYYRCYCHLLGLLFSGFCMLSVSFIL